MCEFITFQILNENLRYTYVFYMESDAKYLYFGSSDKNEENNKGIRMTMAKKEAWRPSDLQQVNLSRFYVTFSLYS